ncbi:MAG: dCTP deaminase [Bacteroidales bacterium]|jgi:dCTP deaminase|nr:dCTP deaminase [Bacteroidales bacterium]
MILSGLEIKKLLNNDIFIDPYEESRLNPNSYNLRLHNELIVYDCDVLDMKIKNKTKSIIIPSEGLLLKPGIIYLGRTIEYTKTLKHVPMLEGRSSIGRLGLYIHVTAGFGDVGFSGYWTLEMSCIQPIKIYPCIEICQIFYHTIQGDSSISYNSKYQNNEGIQASKIYEEFKKNNK